MTEQQQVNVHHYFSIQLAGLVIGISCCYPDTRKICASFLSNSSHPDLSVCVNWTDISEMITSTDTRVPASAIPGVAFSPSGMQFESQLLHRKIADAMPSFDTFLMHGAVVALDGEAYMFTAPSGVGKTTRIMRWLEAFPGSFVVNGDKPLSAARKA